MPNDSMLHWIARAATRLREHAGRKQVHIAASLSMDQSTIYRFEQNGQPDGPIFGWPSRTDRYLAAYAEDLDVAQQDIWLLAMAMWKEGRDLPELVEELLPRGGAAALSAPVEQLARASRSKRQRSAGTRAGRRRPAAD